MRKNIIFFALMIFPLFSMAQTAAGVGEAAKAGAVEEAMKDSVAEPGREVPEEHATNRNSMWIFRSGAVVVVVVAVAAARRRRKNKK